MIWLIVHSPMPGIQKIECRLSHTFFSTPHMKGTRAPFVSERGKFPRIIDIAELLSLKVILTSATRSRRIMGLPQCGELLRIAEADGAVDRKPSVDIFLDLYKRSAAVPTLIEEFLEINWSEQFNIVRLCLAGGTVGTIKTPAGITIEQANFGGTFPEVREVIDWIARRDSDFLVTITGDGEYRFRDVRNGIAVLRDSVFGAVYGSRTQSRGQFNTSVRAAYGEHGLLRWISIFGAFLLTVLYAVRFGVIFSDPLTGFRIYRRRYIQCLRELKPSDRLTPTSITKQLVSHKVEIAELPVRYRTFSVLQIRGGGLNAVSRTCLVCCDSDMLHANIYNLLFDFDGTLANSASLHAQAIVDVLTVERPDLLAAFSYEPLKGLTTAEAFRKIGIGEEPQLSRCVITKQQKYRRLVAEGYLLLFAARAPLWMSPEQTSAACFS